MFEEFDKYTYKPQLFDADEFIQRLKELMENRPYEIKMKDIEIDPNSAEGIMELENHAMRAQLRRPYILYMSKRTWIDLIAPEAKEYIVEQMDAGELEVETSNDISDYAIYIKDKL